MNNKKILTSLLLVLSIGLMIGVVSAQDCLDTDGGLNYGVVGEASRINENNQYLDRCSDKNTLLEAVCGPDGWAAHATYDCSSEGKVCNNGACVEPCSDTDGGKNLLKSGTARFAGQGQGDWCDYSAGENKIREAYCVDDTSYTIDLMDCPSDKPYCNKGECTTEKPQCTEDDSGKNPLVRGTTYPSRIADHTGNTDYCQITSTGQPPANGKCSGSDCSLREFYCPGGPDESYVDIPCPGGCSDGVCASASFQDENCQDSDNGLNYFVKGETTGCNDPFSSVCDTVTLTDTCLQYGEQGDTIWAKYGERVQEINCVMGGPDVSEYTCPNGCYDGACVDINSGNFACSETNKGKICIPTITPEENNPVQINVTEIPDNFKDEDGLSSLCLGCLKDSTCYPLGYRKSGEYCSESKTFTSQLEADSTCENNFECSSNVCVSGKCISESFIQKILNWFAKLFGKK